MIVRAPRPELRPYLGRMWALDAGPVPGPDRERVLPTGGMHLALRIAEAPFRLYDGPHDSRGRAVGRLVVGGPRTRAYIKDTSTAAASVGAELLPGAFEALFGIPAIEVAGRHLSLPEDVDGGMSELLERCHEPSSPMDRLDLFETALALRRPRPPALHPAVALALERLRGGARVGDVVRETGYSHRRFVDLFRHAVGMGPKIFCRLRRFGRAFDELSSCPGSIAALAFASGYSDQAHLNRDFREFAGITPGEYRRLRPDRPGHVPVRPV